MIDATEMQEIQWLDVASVNRSPSFKSSAKAMLAGGLPYVGEAP